MKKFIFLLLIAFLIGGIVSAQQWGNRWGSSQSITVTGTLQLQNGTIAVVNGTTIYYVPILERYIGFIDGLKEGTQVNLEGFMNGNYVQPSKVTLNGKTYDFAVNGPQGRGYNNQGRSHAGYSCCWGW